MNHSKISLFLAFVLTFTSINCALLDLSSDNFAENFNTDLENYATSYETPNRDWFIMFMAPWCGHCNRAKPAFSDFASEYYQNIVADHNQKGASPEELDSKLEESLQIAVVDCTQSSDICQYFGVRGYPTFIYLTSDKKAIQYQGSRSMQAFHNFTKFHDPELHSFCKYIEINNGFWKEMKDMAIDYWPQVIIFGLVLPSLIGFALGNCLFKEKKTENVKNEALSKEENVQTISTNAEKGESNKNEDEKKEK